jgi:hypothetical protein
VRQRQAWPKSNNTLHLRTLTCVKSKDHGYMVRRTGTGFMIFIKAHGECRWVFMKILKPAQELDDLIG